MWKNKVHLQRSGQILRGMFNRVGTQQHFLFGTTYHPFKEHTKSFATENTVIRKLLNMTAALTERWQFPKQKNLLNHI